MRAIYKIYRWFVLVLPPLWIVVLFLAFAGSLQGTYWHNLREHGEFAAMEIAFTNNLLLVMMFTAFSIYRGCIFHPAFREEYMVWLALTPWRHPTPLPLGPPHMVPQDVILLGLFELLLRDAPWELRLALPVILLLAFSLWWMLALWSIDMRSASYEIGYALGAAIWISSFSIIAAVCSVVAIYAWALFRVRQSFASFPWAYKSVKLSKFTQLNTRDKKGVTKGAGDMHWGWSYDALSPHVIDIMPLKDRLLLSGLGGLLAFAFMAHWQYSWPIFLVSMIAGVGGAFYCVMKTYRYVAGHAPPISLSGRLFTGRLLIPSYDVALLPIVYYFACLYMTIYLLEHNLLLPIQYLVPSIFTIYLVLMNLACPDVNRWRLTSPTRMTASASSRNKFEFEQL